ncbi:MAG: OB-fold domain-containing protein [Chloroflexota bacterium]|nr:OB-fold domain-containing protein [Chloroflexota bacterium]
MTTETRAFNAASFFAYLKEGQLMGIRCRACGKLSAEARPMCQECHSRDVEWFAFSGRGQLSAFTCISVVPNAMGEKGFGRNNPYCSGIVTLEEGPRISALILGVDAANPQNIATGMALTLRVEDQDSDRPTLAFVPAQRLHE